MVTAPDLEIARRRLRAAYASEGTSASPIYKAIDHIIETQKLHGDVLDFGAGIGHLTGNLLESRRFKSVSAADIMPVPAQLEGKVQWFERDLNLGIAAPDKSFDVVLAAETIEHLENPRFVARELYRVLRPGGAAVVTTPNNESWRSVFSLLARGHFVAFGERSYPAHITALLRKDFSRMLAEAGFENVEFYFTEEGGIPLKPSITWQRISFGLLRGVRFSDNVLAFARRPAR